MPYTYRFHSGKTVIQYIYDMHYQGAARRQRNSPTSGQPSRAASIRHSTPTCRTPEYQAGHAIVRRDAIVQYFLKQSGIADGRRAGHYPGRLEAEDASLTGYKVIDVTPWKMLPAAKPSSCQATTSQPANKAIRKQVVVNHAFTTCRKTFLDKHSFERGHGLSRAVNVAQNGPPGFSP